MVEVVRIVDSEKPGDYIVINAALYDSQVHALFTSEEEPSEIVAHGGAGSEAATEEVAPAHPRGPGRPRKAG